MKKHNQNQSIENMEKCPNFDRCSQNFCPLDLELELRSGKKNDVCRWMREAKISKVAGREFVSGGSVMPGVILNFVPRKNLGCLNKESQDKWKELKKTDLNIEN